MGNITIHNEKIIKIYIKNGGKIHSVTEAVLIAGRGIDCDDNARGGDRQISLLTDKAYATVKSAGERGGICAARFRPNLVIEQLSYSFCEGDMLRLGSAVCQVTQVGKACLDDCILYKSGDICPLSQEAVFMRVEKSGAIAAAKA